MTAHKSEVAAFRERQRLEEEAAQRGLTGTAIVAQHKIITAKMERWSAEIERGLAACRTEEERAAFIKSAKCPVNPS